MLIFFMQNLFKISHPYKKNLIYKKIDKHFHALFFFFEKNNLAHVPSCSHLPLNSADKAFVSSEFCIGIQGIMNVLNSRFLDYAKINNNKKESEYLTIHLQ